MSLLFSRLPHVCSLRLSVKNSTEEDPPYSSPLLLLPLPLLPLPLLPLPLLPSPAAATFSLKTWKIVERLPPFRVFESLVRLASLRVFESLVSVFGLVSCPSFVAFCVRWEVLG